MKFKLYYGTFFQGVECFTTAWKIPWHELQKEILTLWKSKDVIENVHPVPDIPPIVLLLVDMGARGLTNH